MTDRLEHVVLIVPETICQMKMQPKSESLEPDTMACLSEDTIHENILVIFSKDCFCGDYLGAIVGGTVSFLLHLIFFIPYLLLACIPWALNGFPSTGTSAKRIVQCRTVLCIPWHCCWNFNMTCLAAQQLCDPFKVPTS